MIAFIHLLHPFISLAASLLRFACPLAVERLRLPASLPLRRFCVSPSHFDCPSSRRCFIHSFIPPSLDAVLPCICLLVLAHDVSLSGSGVWEWSLTFEGRTAGWAVRRGGSRRDRRRRRRRSAGSRAAESDRHGRESDRDKGSDCGCDRDGTANDCDCESSGAIGRGRESGCGCDCGCGDGEASESETGSGGGEGEICTRRGQARWSRDAAGCGSVRT